MLMGAVIWSITGNLHKIATVNSTPLFYGVTHQLVVAAYLGIYIFWKQRSAFLEVIVNYKRLLLIAALASVMILCTMGALTTGVAVYVFAIKRTSVLMGVVLGALIFKEGGFRERLTGASIMVCGVFFTAI